MKILITAPDLDESRNVSGISTIVRQIIEHGSDEYSHFIAGRQDGEKTGPKWLAKQALLPFKFAKQLRAFGPDIVHINTALTDLSIYRDSALVAVARLMGKRVTIAIHGGKYLIEDIENAVLKTVTSKMLNAADSIIVYSEYERGLINKKWQKLNIFTLPNAIPGQFIGNAERDNAESLLVYFGRMHESKGLHELVDACSALNSAGFKFQLHAYGEGPIREFFVTEMSKAIGGSFTYGGVIGGEEKWPILRKADLFVLPSRYGEGLPMAMLEAMAAGCIVVVGDVASVSSVISDGHNGYLVKPYDAAGLASRLKIILSEKLEWPAMREHAVQTIRTNFEIAAYIERLEDIYRKTVGK